MTLGLKGVRANVMKHAVMSCIVLPMIFSGANLPGSQAQDSEPETEADALPWAKGSVQVGGLVAFFHSELTFGVKGGGNASINGEDLLGLDSTLAVFRADAFYRPGASRRNQIDFTYAAYERDGSAILSQDLTIGDTTYPIGAKIQSVLNFDLIRGTYSYAFLQNNWARIGAGLGVYAIPLRYGLNIQTEGGHSAVGGADTTLPLPALALRAEFQLYSKLFLTTSLDGMYLEVNDFKGSLVDLNMGLEYRARKHLGFGVGYNFLSADVEGKSSSSDYPGADFVGEVTVRFSGLLVYGKLSF
jgi:hypothetical protein